VDARLARQERSVIREHRLALIAVLALIQTESQEHCVFRASQEGTTPAQQTIVRPARRGAIRRSGRALPASIARRESFLMRLDQTTTPVKIALLINTQMALEEANAMPALLERRRNRVPAT